MCGAVLFGPVLHCERDISEAISTIKSHCLCQLIWARSSSLLVMSTDGGSLFCVDTENHSSQLGPQ